MIKLLLAIDKTNYLPTRPAFSICIQERLTFTNRKDGLQ